MALVSLIVAIQNADMSSFEQLLAANPHMLLDQPGEGEGPNGCSSLHWASHCDEPVMIDRLLKHASADLHVRNKRGNTVLHTAAARGCVRALRQLLLHGIDLNASNLWGESALHLAASADQAPAVALLLEARAEPNHLDSWTRSPLCVARENGSQHSVRLLQAAGAKDVGETPKQREQDDGKGRSLQEAVGTEFMRVLQTRNAQRPAAASTTTTTTTTNTTTTNTTTTTTVSATTTVLSATAVTAPQKASTLPSLSKLLEYPGDPVLVERLLREGKVDPGGKDMFGWTALHKFSAWDKIDLLALIVPVLTPEQMRQSGGPEGFSALHSAVEMGSERAVRYLLSSCPALREAKDRKGRTALSFALQMGEEGQQVALLLQQCSSS